MKMIIARIKDIIFNSKKRKQQNIIDSSMPRTYRQGGYNYLTKQFDDVIVITRHGVTTTYHAGYYELIGDEIRLIKSRIKHI